MKSVVTLALSALAVTAFNPQDYIEGFGQQFGLDQSAVQDALDCVTGLQGNAIEVVQLIQQNQDNLPGLLSQAQGIVENLQASLAAECQPIAEDIAIVIYQSVGNQNMQEVVKRNFEHYFPQLVQKAAYWVHFLAAGNDIKAGQTDAYILQVLLGIVQPDTIPVPEPTKFVYIDEDKYMNEYFTAFYNALGMDVDINALKTCVKETNNFTDSLGKLINQFPNLDYVGRIEAIKTFVIEAAEELEGCEGVYNLQKEIFVKVIEAAGDDKLGFLLKSIDNLALNFPSIISLKQQVMVDTYEGEYVLAGEDDAKIIQIIDGGRVFN